MATLISFTEPRPFGVEYKSGRALKVLVPSDGN